MCLLAAFYFILCLGNSTHLTGLLICMGENEKAVVSLVKLQHFEGVKILWFFSPYLCYFII